MGLLALGATFIGGHILECNHVTRLPGVGLIPGGLVSYLAVAGGFEIISSHEKFDFEFFMTWLLPPIIFEAGYNMNVNKFMANLAPTMFFAFIGTFASTSSSVESSTRPARWPVLSPERARRAHLRLAHLGDRPGDGARGLPGARRQGRPLLDGLRRVGPQHPDASRDVLSFNKPGAEVNQESINGAGISFCTIFGGCW